jgi:hypothetical protein
MLGVRLAPFAPFVAIFFSLRYLPAFSWRCMDPTECRKNLPHAKDAKLAKVGID